MKKIETDVSIEEALADRMVKPILFARNDEWFIVNTHYLDDAGNFRVIGKDNRVQLFRASELVDGIKSGSIEGYQLEDEPIYDIAALVVKVKYGTDQQYNY